MESRQITMLKTDGRKEMVEDCFMGQPISFWMELKYKSDMLNVTDILRENALLRAKVSYYEDMINKMNSWREVNSAL